MVQLFPLKLHTYVSVTPKASSNFDWTMPLGYRIVPDKHPWVLAAQATKIEGGWLH